MDKLSIYEKLKDIIYNMACIKMTGDPVEIQKLNEANLEHMVDICRTIEKEFCNE